MKKVYKMEAKRLSPGAYVRRAYYENTESGKRDKFEVIGVSAAEFKRMVRAAGIEM